MGFATSKRDVVWSYVGTVVSMSSGFVLLPLLLVFLSEDELGLWYVFLAISSLTQLFEWGFEPTFARNIVYVLSGARKLSRQGCDPESVKPGVDEHLLKVVFKTSKLVFGIVAVLSTVLVIVFGTLYVVHISDGMAGSAYWVAWGIFCFAIFTNLYYLYCVTFLRGAGDVAAENRAKTFGRLSQLVLSAVFLLAGFGLVGAAVGYLANGLLVRLLSFYYLKRHRRVYAVFIDKVDKVKKREVEEMFSVISFVAARNSLVQLASFASTQATTILCSLFLSLGETGIFSVGMQLGNAVCNFACAYMRSCFPALQAAYGVSDTEKQRSIVSKGIVVFWIFTFAGTMAVPVVVFPLVGLLRPGYALDVPLFLGLSLYLAIWNHCNLLTNVILSANYIPFTRAFVISSLFGIALSSFLMAFVSRSAWSLVLGLLVAQIIYNGWKWPLWVMRSLKTSYVVCLKEGLSWLGGVLTKKVSGLFRSGKAPFQ